MRHAGRKLLGAAAMAAAGAAVLPFEWKMAKRGPQLPDDPPFDHDGRVGGDGPALKVLWLGDSGAAGAGASSVEAALPTRVAVGLGRPVDQVVLAVSGSKVADVLADQVQHVAEHEPDIVIVHITTNDVLYHTPPEAIRRDYAAVLRALPAGVLVLALGPIDMGATARLMQPLRAVVGRRGQAINLAARAAAEETGAVFVDIAAATGRAFRRDPGRFLCIDKFHASDAGYQLIADAVLAELRPALDRRAEAGTATR